MDDALIWTLDSSRKSIKCMAEWVKCEWPKTAHWLLMSDMISCKKNRIFRYSTMSTQCMHMQCDMQAIFHSKGICVFNSTFFVTDDDYNFLSVMLWCELMSTPHTHLEYTSVYHGDWCQKESAMWKWHLYSYQYVRDIDVSLFRYQSANHNIDSLHSNVTSGGLTHWLVCSEV